MTEALGFNVLDFAICLLRDGTLSIDSEGRIWRHYVRTKTNRKPIQPRRAENPTRKGYLDVTLGVPGTRRTRAVKAHILVWTWLRGEIPDGLQVNHKDLIKTNNHQDNLELLTGAGNIQHSYANGRPRPWHKATEWRPGIPRRSPEQIDEIYRLIDSGASQAEVCRAQRVSRTHLRRLLKRRKEAQ